ncbi:hypothetical protein JOS77_08175 [Chromobacterium haemolyticum]|nr:hypothetical protein JOS77_08175 [Chromobacterium haemolyticum]
MQEGAEELEYVGFWLRVLASQSGRHPAALPGTGAGDLAAGRRQRRNQPRGGKRRRLDDAGRHDARPL